MNKPRPPNDYKEHTLHQSDQCMHSKDGWDFDNKL